jgi:hypothetical protein
VGPDSKSFSIKSLIKKFQLFFIDISAKFSIFIRRRRVGHGGAYAHEGVKQALGNRNDRYCRNNNNDTPNLQKKEFIVK